MRIVLIRETTFIMLSRQLPQATQVLGLLNCLLIPVHHAPRLTCRACGGNKRRSINDDADYLAHGTPEDLMLLTAKQNGNDI